MGQYMRNMADYEAFSYQEDAIAWRNGIAESMWVDYLAELQRRGL